MGCASSSSTPVDAQAMLERQREIMLQRQKEFEQRRQQQSATGPSPGTPGKSIPAVVAAGAKTSSTAASPAKNPPTKAGPTGFKLDGGSSNPPSREQSRDGSISSQPVEPKVASPVEQKPAQQVPEPKAVQQPVEQKAVEATRRASFNPRSASSTGSTTKTSEPSLSPAPEPIESKVAVADPAVAARRASFNPAALGGGDNGVGTKFMLDSNDLAARRSKNVHDLAMYGKDVTRRASFNPRPKESPFTPEMQAMMRAGHEAMMAMELEKKQQRLATGENVTTVPEFEDEEAAKERAEKEKAAEKERAAILAAAASAEPTNAPAETKAAEESKPPKNSEEEGEEFSKDSAANDADLPKRSDTADVDSKFVPRDPKDRLSKNIHDYGQFMGQAKGFARRASYLPPPVPGGQ